MFIPKRKHYVTIFLFFQEIPMRLNSFSWKNRGHLWICEEDLERIFLQKWIQIFKKPFMISIAIFEGRLSMAFWNKRMAFFPSWQKKKKQMFLRKSKEQETIESVRIFWSARRHKDLWVGLWKGKNHRWRNPSWKAMKWLFPLLNWFSKDSQWILHCGAREDLWRSWPSSTSGFHLSAWEREMAVVTKPFFTARAKTHRGRTWKKPTS